MYKRQNCKTMTKIFKTPNFEEWVNKQIQIGSVMVDAFGEKVDSDVYKRQVLDTLAQYPGDPTLGKLTFMVSLKNRLADQEGVGQQPTFTRH